MIPHHLKSFAQSIVATILLASNVYFFLKSGYVETDANEKPLLHTWSLGAVEEQYIGFPWLVVGFWRFGPKVLGGVIAATLLGSLVASELALRAYPLANFYLAQTRAWELALGSLVAIWSFYHCKFIIFNVLRQPKIHEGSRCRTGKPSPWFFAVFAALSIVCAYGTWRFVEKLFRDRQRFTRHQIFAFSFGGSIFFCAVGLTGHYQEVLPGRLKPEVRQILNFGEQPETHTNGYPKSECFLSSGRGATAMGHCVDFETATGESVFLWG